MTWLAAEPPLPSQECQPWRGLLLLFLTVVNEEVMHMSTQLHVFIRHATEKPVPSHLGINSHSLRALEHSQL